MPRPKAPGRNRKAQENEKGNVKGNARKQPRPSSDIPSEEMSVENLIRELEKARDFAKQKGRAAAAVTATVAIVRLLRLLPDKPGRPPSSHKPGRSPALPAKFDGNYNDAARRILFLLGLAAKERAEEPDKANGQERDRSS
jgi:hypothetical protein